MESPARRRPARRLAFAAATALLAAGCARQPSATVGVEDAWVRLAAVPGRPAAAYLTLRGATAPARLVAVDADAAGSTELHEMLNRSGPDGGPPVMSMDRVDGVDVPAGQAVALAPGGTHVMLFGLAPSVKPGDRLALTVRFARGDPVRAQAKVVAAGDPAPY